MLRLSRKGTKKSNIWQFFDSAPCIDKTYVSDTSYRECVVYVNRKQTKPPQHKL
jgi:hypothetical protein